MQRKKYAREKFPGVAMIKVLSYLFSVSDIHRTIV